MKLRNRIIAIAAASAALQPFTAFAADPVYEGDVVLAFYEIVGGIVQNDTYTVNIGQGSLYRENTTNNVPLSTVNPGLASSNIGADLAATFGSDWADTGTVVWLLVGGVSQGGTPDPYFVTEGGGPSGDPARTTYYSRPRNNLTTSSSGPGTTTVSSLSSTNRGIFSNSVTPFLTGYNYGTGVPALSLPKFQTNNSTNGTNAASAIFPKANQNTVEEYLPPATTTFFGVASTLDPRQTLNPGVIAGGAGVEGALDIYRIIDTTSGADLTHGASSGNASVGVPKFVGTITLSATGDLRVTSIPSAGNYASWATANGIAGQPAGDDFDNDGLDNLTEYAIAGLSPTVPNGSPGTFANNLLSFSKRAEAVANGDVTYAIEESDDLGVGDPWQTVTPTSNTSSVITYQLPSGSPRKFARLRLVSTP